MITRFGTVLALATVAGLSYVGAARLGRWLDDPVDASSARDGLSHDDRPHSHTGWRRWTAHELADP